MKAAVRQLCTALGFSGLIMAGFFQPFLKSGHNLLYHWSGSPGRFFGPVLADFCIALLSSILVFSLAERGRQQRLTLWLVLLALLPMVFVKSVSLACQFSFPLWLKCIIAVAETMFLAWLVTLWRKPDKDLLSKHVTFATTMLTFLGFGTLLMVGQLSWYWWSARWLNDAAPARHAKLGIAAGTKPSRIIWIVFDELSYKEVFEQREPDIHLDAFDGVASQSSSFMNVVPAGYYTEKIVPALFTGHPVEGTSSSLNGQLLTRGRGDTAFSHFDAHQTVFQDALNQGYRTAVAGWYNPYCRILGNVIEDCYWTYAAAGSKSFLGDMLLALHPLTGSGMASRVVDRFSSNAGTTGVDRSDHLRDHEDLLQAADKVLLEPDNSFVFLHLPIPHPAGIYDRVSSHLSTEPSTYMDNLVLADKILAHFRQELQSRGEWDASTVIIMGDHGWRVDFWKSVGMLTPQEVAANHGMTYDSRPVFLVKLPRQTQGTTISRPFHALGTRALMNALMHQQIKSPQDLDAWAQAH